MALLAVAESKLIVLYVEDEESDRLFVSRAFAKEGCEPCLRMVNDGRAAMDYLSGVADYADRERFPLPRVVLLDLNLPEIHGFEVLKWIREHPLHSELPVVIFTSSTRDEDRARAQLLGANQFVPKPNTLAAFGDVVRNLVARWLSAGGPTAPGSTGSPGSSNLVAD